MATSYNFAITISKYNRGSMNADEITITVDHFKSLNPSILLITNEHQNFKGESFEHLHIAIRLSNPIRSDNFRRSLKKNLSFLEHHKDICIKSQQTDEWLQYCLKSDDFTILAQIGISEEQLEEYKEKSKIYVDKKEIAKLPNKKQINSRDVPFIMIQYIQFHNFNYTGDYSQFKNLIFSMFQDDYYFDIKGKLMQYKTILDMQHLQNTELLEKLIEQEIFV